MLKRAPRVVFAFPGQGSYHYSIVRELWLEYPQTHAHFEIADRTCRRFLGVPFLPLPMAADAKAHDALLDANPELDQVGIYLTEVILAELLINEGLRPSLTMGHSFGDLASLTTAGVIDAATGLKIVCQRVLALRTAGEAGGMAALSCNPERARKLLAEAGAGGLEISVLNHASQTVVSGAHADLEALREFAPGQGITVTLLKSRHPFHSSRLARAADLFRTNLNAYEFNAPAIPVTICTEKRILTPDCDVAELLASQFVKPLDFSGLLKEIAAEGDAYFVECGGGDVLTKLVLKNCSDRSGILAHAVAVPGVGVRAGIEKTVAEARKAGVFRPESAALQVTGQLRQLEGKVVALEGMIQSARITLQQILGTHAAPAYSAGLRIGLAEVELKPAIAPAPARRQYPAEQCPEEPIAITSLGCVLPGAANPDEYWRNILDGVSGIVDLTQHDPHASHDFIRGTPEKIVSEKSYTLLNGSILATRYEAGILSPWFTEEAFSRLGRGQRILALAIAQTLAELSKQVTSDASLRIQCILGGTADGAEEYDEALFADSLYARADRLRAPEPMQSAFEQVIEKVTGYPRGSSEGMAQHDGYRQVVDRFFGRPISTYVVDTACSSSLYSIDLAIKALRDGESDLVLAGGVFAPGPANNTLFAQFRGLTPKESRPLDAAADGVVFGDGAALVALKRLSDAVKAGDRVLGVIRGVGLSSDGRSPSINVPQASGQRMAIERAYARSGVDRSTIQYIEAHATATPVGDATEFQGLKEAFSARGEGAPRIELGSVKALIGHTGWASGVASIIKFCCAFRHRTVPRQYAYTSPNRAIDLEGSPFTIASETRPWVGNSSNLPRRGAINGFGFGGTNAHLILEEYDEEFHRELCAQKREPAAAERTLAIVGVGSLFPAHEALGAHEPNGRLQFERSAMRLPAKKMLLPDVREHMDASQYLAGLAAEQVLTELAEKWPQWKDDIGVVLGVASKTERGMRANERIFMDRLRRRIATRERAGEVIPDAQVVELVERLCQDIATSNIASGPYSLAGLMPNVAASRISSLFDLKGPNIVIDRGEDSLHQSIVAAERLLVHGNCPLVLAGGISATGGPFGGWAEGVLILGLMTLDSAKKAGVPIRGLLTVCPSGSAVADGAIELQPSAGPDYRGARGGPQIVKALALVEQGKSVVLRSADTGASAPPALCFSPVATAKISVAHTAPAVPAAAPTPAAAPAEIGAYAFVQGTPIYTMTPVLHSAPPTDSRVSLQNKRILFLVDQAEWWKAVEDSGALNGRNYQAVCPAPSAVPGAIPVDVTSEENATRSLAALDPAGFDAIILLKSLKTQSAKALLDNDLAGETGLADLLFAASKHCYQRIAAGAVSVSSVCLSAFERGDLDPYTGLIAGFMKSLGRELPPAACSIVNLDEDGILRALSCTEVELGQGKTEGEVCVRAGERFVFKLEAVETLASDAQPCLTRDSVVIATGGGRGVTAVLCETLLERFGCRVIALGRTEMSGVPEKILRMTAEQYQAFEAEFYREELALNPRQKITELKKKYWSYQAANELHQVIERLRSAGGSFEYKAVDITDAQSVERLVEEVYQKYGRVDMVLHGAGIQISKIIPKKTLGDFRKIVGTKLASLQYFYRACERRRGAAPVHFHLLTSAFSYLGNDGQPDYGAANEAMNRLAAAMGRAEPTSYWSSMAWLGWAGIGMTRGSEFAALAANRRLRGVSKEEGQEIFGRLMAGRPAAAINVVMADGEIKFYGTAVAERSSAPARAPVAPRPMSREQTLDFTVENSPYLLDHLVHGVPTLPGAFIIGMVADFAHQLRPELKIVAFENTEFVKFVYVFRNKGIRVRLEGKVVEETAADTLIHVRVLSDFTHKSGVLLQKDVVHTELSVRMAQSVPRPPRADASAELPGLLLPDPYVMNGSPVRLNGRFNSIRKLVVGESDRRAEYRLSDYPYPASPYLYLLPNIIMVDAFWRFGTVEVKPDRTLSVFVPRKCDIMRVFFDYTDFSQPALNGSFVFRGVNPRVDGDLLHVGPIEVCNQLGEVQLIVEGGLCQRFGNIENAY
jgi:3-oxoacyl-(acyl-carrier-protein) synthase/NAD(P)-dependent dehydrogenase (short-subunit alcohol dehydrogenase family)